MRANSPVRHGTIRGQARSHRIFKIFAAFLLKTQKKAPSSRGITALHCHLLSAQQQPQIANAVTEFNSELRWDDCQRDDFFYFVA